MSEPLRMMGYDGRPDPVLRGLREAACSQALQRAARGSLAVPEASVLRPEVHGPDDGQGRSDARWSSLEGRSATQGRVRRVRLPGEAARSPRRRRPVEQHRSERSHALRVLSHPLALAEREAGPIARKLRGLRRAGAQASTLQQALPAIQEVRRCSLDEAQRRRPLAAHPRVALFPRLIQAGHLLGRMVLDHEEGQLAA
jgi:hypothetical protein